MERTVKALKVKELEGLSEKQLKEHHDVLYAGYVKKTNAIRAALKDVDVSSANATFSDLRELKVEETFAVNGVKLHEAYFDNLGGDGNCQDLVKDWIERDFGSLEVWEKEFRASGLASRGWVVLAFDLEERRLYNVVCDLHNQGAVWGYVPLLVMDVYEHAYFIDYATARKAYIDAFMKNIDWAAVNSRIECYKLKE